ncbi:MAG: hypothetical protein JO017_11050 [Actinobacteria bacterium]|nr:hypothetical protein [Actinomycetota bacterium]
MSPRAQTVSALRRARVVGLLAASLLAAAGPARASTTATSQHWSGYVVTGTSVAYTRVTGTWNEPAVDCTHSRGAALSVVSVGLGGFVTGADKPEQVGTDANCSARHEPSYYAWFELSPDVAHTINAKVEPGDTITGLVKLLRINLVEIRVRDATRHWTFMRKITLPATDTTSAEWIVEAPYACRRFTCRQASLANFGSVEIHGIAATGNGSNGTLAHRAWTRTRLRFVPCTPNSKAGASTRGMSSDGSTFTIAWIRNAGATRCAPDSTSAMLGSHH